MSTPTPRTDATWSMSFYPPEFSAAHTVITKAFLKRIMKRALANMRKELAA